MTTRFTALLQVVIVGWCAAPVLAFIVYGGGILSMLLFGRRTEWRWSEGRWVPVAEERETEAAPEAGQVEVVEIAGY